MNPRWDMVPLCTEVKLLSGGTPKKSEAKYWGGEIPWVSSGAMTQRRIRDTELHVTEDGAENGTRLISENTVLVVVRGMSLAKEFRISLTGGPVTFNQDLKALRTSPKVDSGFLFYYLQSQKNAIRDSATEASHGTKKIETRVLETWPLPVPALAEQYAVRDILTAYDDLIENNRRRIQLLEQAARLLYKEWFVHLRFPGHEHVKIKDGVPDGWEKKKLFDVAIPTYGFSFKSALFNTEAKGLPLTRIRDIPSGESQTYTTEEAPKDKLLEDGDFVIGMDGDFHMNFWTGGKAWINQRVVRIQGIEDVSTAYLRYACEKQIQDLNATIVGTTVAHLGAKHLKLIKVLIPPKGILYEAQGILELIRSQIVSLSNQSKLANKAREFLLPRLMSGELVV